MSLAAEKETALSNYKVRWKMVIALARDFCKRADVPCFNPREAFM